MSALMGKATTRRMSPVESMIVDEPRPARSAAGRDRAKTLYGRRAAKSWNLALHSPEAFISRVCNPKTRYQNDEVRLKQTAAKEGAVKDE